MNPEIIIVVEGGVVQCVATTRPQLTYRLIDLDDEAEESALKRDYEADDVNINLEEYTRRMMA